MKKLLLSLLAAFVCVTVQADNILVYKKNLTVTTTGGGKVQRATVGGWMIWDADNFGITFIDVDTRAKKYRVHGPQNTVGDIAGNLGAKSSVIRIDDGFFTGMIFKGANRANSLYAPAFTQFPTSLTVIGADFYATSENFLDEYRGNCFFDAIPSKAAVAEDLDFNQVGQRLIATLTAKGFTEIVE